MPVPPLRLLPQFALDRCTLSVLRRYPSLEDAVTLLSGARIGIDPTDLPVAFLIDCAARPPRVTLCRAVGPDNADAVIRGTLLTLLDLCDGRLDGDAAFFARRLSFEGDIATVVALRNALDGADIDLRRDIRQGVDRLPPPLRHLAGLGMNAAGRLYAMKHRQEVGDIR